MQKEKGGKERRGLISVFVHALSSTAEEKEKRGGRKSQWPLCSLWL